MTSAKVPLRLISGGRDEMRLGQLRVTVAPPTAPPFPVAAAVLEEDSWQVMSARPELATPAEHPVRLLTRLWAAEPQPAGSVVLREGTPLRLLAIVHDFGQEPSCHPQWVAAALAEILRIAEQRALRSLSLPLLGVRHGRLAAADFVELLKVAVRESTPRQLHRIWLVVPEEQADELRGLLVR